MPTTDENNKKIFGESFLLSVIVIFPIAYGIYKYLKIISYEYSITGISIGLTIFLLILFLITIDGLYKESKEVDLAKNEAEHTPIAKNAFLKFVYFAYPFVVVDQFAYYSYGKDTLYTIFF